MESKEKKLGLGALILMIFTSVYGFNNIPRSFYLMGYAAIPWFILAGITFFVPYAFMVAEYGSAFKNTPSLPPSCGTRPMYSGW